MCDHAKNPGIIDLLIVVINSFKYERPETSNQITDATTAKPQTTQA